MPLAFPRQRLLILIAQPEYLSTDDLMLIREKIAEKAPSLRVLVVGRSDRAELIDSRLWQLPTLTVSFGPTGKFRPLRGRVFQNRSIPKLEQFKLLSAAGIRTPMTDVFQFGMQLPESQWGKFCILKPAALDATSSGRGLYLYRTARLSAIGKNDLPADHFALNAPMLVQSFVDTGPRFAVYRALTLFGEVIYQNLAVAPQPHPTLETEDTTLESILPEPPRHLTAPQINTDQDVMTFASTLHNAFPELPLLGCDLLREHATGKIYAIEVNAGGNVWHLSSPRTQASRSVTKIQKYLETFQSYDKAAVSLIRAATRYAT